MRPLPALRLLAALALAACALFGTRALRADQADDALRFFDGKVAAMAKQCGDKVWDAATGAKSQGFHQHATETAQVLLDDWDANHAGAREMLGYARKGTSWELDPNAKVERQNMKNTKESQKSFDDRVKKWKDAYAKVNQFIATKYAAIGAECAAKSYDEQAKKSMERALTYDPECEPARKALGYERFGKIWVTKAKADSIKRALSGAPVEGESELEKLLGVKLNKFATPHFRIEDDGSKDALPEAAKNLETLYAYYLLDAGRDPTQDVFGGKVVEMCVVSNKAAWDKWAEKRSGEKDLAFLKESNTYRNLLEFRTGTMRVETADVVDTRDPLLHHAAHLLGWYVWKSKRHAWLDEGLAYYYVVKVQDTTRTHCVAKEEAGYGKSEPIGGFKDWTVSERWKLYLRDIVRKKDDADLRLLMGQPLATLTLPQSVKAWGVISWLMDTRREKFLAFLTALRDRKDGPGQTPAEIFERTFANSVEGVDTEWRAFAVRAY